MTSQLNPFVHAGANDLPADILLSYYIEDNNYSRFLQSRRNVMLVGERGSGKSMALLFNSWPIQTLKSDQDKSPRNYNLVGIYVPCNTTLFRKVDPELLSPTQGAAIYEHFLVLSIAREIVSVIEKDQDILNQCDKAHLSSVFEYIVGCQLPSGMSYPASVKAFIDRSLRETQQSLNRAETREAEYVDTFSFVSLILPLLRSFQNIDAFKHTHFMLLIDDAHYLNSEQMKALNSWVAYRDHSLYSLKIAIADLSKYSLETTSGGNILEGHDYMRLDMVHEFHNKRSDFGQLAKKLIEKRLVRFGINVTAEEYFPISDSLKRHLCAAEKMVRQEAIDKYGKDSKRQIQDHVYKYARAQYFRKRDPRANRPEYSGFSILVFLATGVVRNLLIPCYWMYEKVLAQDENADKLAQIPSRIQSETIIERSQGLWDTLRNGLDKHIVGCSSDDARHAYQLLDQLACLFRERLDNHKSEPRANSFTISAVSDASGACSDYNNLEHLLKILMDAQYIYRRSGPAKEKGKREWYYIPNRLLWPERGLDPHGQHARVSLKAKDLWAAAERNTAFNDSSVGIEEPTLFDDESGRK